MRFPPLLRKAIYSHFLQFYYARLVPRYGLYAPTLRIKTVTDSGDLLALLSFNIAYEYKINILIERHINTQKYLQFEVRQAI